MNRKQRRALGLGKDSPLQGVLEGLQKVQDLGKAAEEVGKLGGALGDARDQLGALVYMKDDLLRTAGEVQDRLARVEYEVGRQRAVMLRFLWGLNQERILPEQSVADFLAVEERYQAEYDAMTFLVWLLTFVGQGGPSER